MNKKYRTIKDFLDKPLSQFTIADLFRLFKTEMQEENESIMISKDASSKKEYVYGIAGLAKLFGCSKATAQRIKSNGTIDAAIFQCGKIIVVDAKQALDLLKVSNNKWGNKKSK